MPRLSDSEDSEDEQLEDVAGEEESDFEVTLLISKDQNLLVLVACRKTKKKRE